MPRTRFVDFHERRERGGSRTALVLGQSLANTKLTKMVVKCIHTVSQVTLNVCHGKFVLPTKPTTSES